MDLPKGSRLGRFVVDRRLGRGASGAVYLAYEPGAQTDVAVKVLSPLLVDDAAVLQRFRRAATWTRRLNHPGICQIFDVHNEGGWTFLSMQHVAGATLSRLLQTRGPLSPEETLQMLRGLAPPLDAAHAQGIIHGDLKPGNIMVAEGFEVTLLDFGVAATDNVTQIAGVGRTLDSLRFIAPEMWQGEAASPRTDVYALGVVLYTCLTGHPPDEEAEAAGAHPRRGQLATAATEHSRRTVEAVVRRCMAKDPTRRFASAGDVRRAFEEAVAAASTPDAARALAQMHEAFLEDDPKGARRTLTRGVRAAAGVCILVVVLGSLWLVLGERAGSGSDGSAEPQGTRTRTKTSLEAVDLAVEGEEMCLEVINTGQADPGATHSAGDQPSPLSPFRGQEGLPSFPAWDASP